MRRGLHTSRVLSAGDFQVEFLRGSCCQRVAPDAKRFSKTSPPTLWGYAPGTLDERIAVLDELVSTDGEQDQAQGGTTKRDSAYDDLRKRPDGDYAGARAPWLDQS